MMQHGFRVERAAATLLAVLILGAMAIRPGQAQSSSDLFDLSAGAKVVKHSPLIPGVSDARDILGGFFSPVETGNTIFADNQGDSFVHFLRFDTPAPIFLSRVDLYAQGDLGASYGSDFRDFGAFRLYGRMSSTEPFRLLAELASPDHPFVHAAAPFTFDLAGGPAARQFRLEFDQYNKGFFDSGYLGGPRIIEVDGFGEVVPEPGAAGLLAAASLAGCLILARRRRRA